MDALDGRDKYGGDLSRGFEMVDNILQTILRKSCTSFCDWLRFTLSTVNEYGFILVDLCASAVFAHICVVYSLRIHAVICLPGWRSLWDVHSHWTAGPWEKRGRRPVSLQGKIMKDLEKTLFFLQSLSTCKGRKRSRFPSSIIYCQQMAVVIHELTGKGTF